MFKYAYLHSALEFFALKIFVRLKNSEEANSSIKSTVSNNHHVMKLLY